MRLATRWLVLLSAAALLGIGGPPTAGVAHARLSACPAIDPTYTGNCGPTFVLPGSG